MSMITLTTLAKSKLTVFSVAGATLLFVFYTTRKRTRPSSSHDGNIPVPKAGYPLIGQLFSLGSVPSLQISKWQEILGPLLRLNMGSQKWILISDPYIAHDIFMTRGVFTSGRPTGSYGSDIYGYSGRGIVFANNTKKWKYTRTAVLSILAPNKVDEYDAMLTFEADILVKALVNSDNDVDPFDLLHWTSYNCIMQTCFGQRAASTDDQVFQSILHLLEQGGRFAGAFGYLAKMQTFVTRYRDDIFMPLIHQAVQQNTDCMAKQLYDLKDEFGLDDLDILVTMSDLIVAGADTIAVTLRWAFAILSHHMDVQKQICQELDAFIIKHRRLPSFADRDHLPYMISVQRECMRYRPTVPFSAPHCVNEDFDYQGYHFYKDDILLSNMYLMHQDPTAYDQPKKFVPDRFLKVNKTMMASANGSIHQRDHYNFGWGRRVCPGIYLAENEVFNVWVRLFAQCTIQPKLDGQGLPILPDLDKLVDGGIVLMPERYSLRFNRRDDAVIV